MAANQHADGVEYDERRTQWLQKQGFHVIRFWNNEVLLKIEGVLEKIVSCPKNNDCPPPFLPVKGGRDERSYFSG